MNHIRIIMLLTMISGSVYGSFLSRVDPAPLFTTANMLGNYTNFGHCESEYHVRLNVTPFRQNAYKGYRYNDHNSAAIWTSTATTIDNNECEIGNLYGSWNYLGLFYTKSIRDLFPAEPLKIFFDTATSDLKTNTINAKYALPTLSDPNQKIGFLSAPMEFRSYGCRLQADVITPLGLGISGKLSIGQRQQVPGFKDLTQEATTGSDFSAEDKSAISALIFNRLPAVAEKCGLSVRPYCEDAIDQGIISVFFIKSFDCFPDQESKYSDFICTPFIGLDWLPPLHETNPNDLLAINLGTNGHLGYGFHTGITFNFLETIEIGFDLAPTWFSSKTYRQVPMPINLKQVGFYPHKADYTLEPGSNWSFGASMAAFNFTQLFSASCEVRYIHHCKDHITLISAPTFSDKCFEATKNQGTPVTYTFTENDQILSYMPALLEDRSSWSSCFINLGVNMNICDGFQLGLAGQLPLRMRNAYYSTSVLGSLSVSY